MNERIIEIVLYLAAILKDKTTLEQNDLRQLTQDGFTAAEIRQAVKLLEGSGEPVTSAALASTKSFRVLHPSEHFLFATESWGFLLQLNALEVLNPFAMEEVIERARFEAARPLTIDETKQIVHEVLVGDGIGRFGDSMVLGSMPTRAN